MLRNNSYTSLHGHSDYSNIRLLDCTTKVSDIFDRAHELGLNGLAITDHECLSSFVSAEKYLNEKKEKYPEDEKWQRMKFIRGNEIYLTRDGLNKDNYERGKDRYFHFILIAKDYIGYQQLCKLSTKAWSRAYRHYQFRVPTYYKDLVEVLETNPGHLIASTACIGGQIGAKLLEVFNKETPYDEAFTYCTHWINRMIELFGEGHFYLELQPGVSPEQVYCNKEIKKLSEVTGAPLIITTDHHYTKQEDRQVHKAFLTSKHGDREVDAFYEATYMMDIEEIQQRLEVSFNQDAEKICEIALENTNLINSMCEDYSLLKSLSIPYIPTTFDVEENIEEHSLYEQVSNKMPALQLYVNSDQKCNRQFAARMFNFMIEPDKGDETPRYLIKDKVENMNNELDIIWESGKKLNVDWSAYLLMVSDYLEIFWTEGDTIVAPSRGSAGASYSCHALGINQIDPTREKAPLVFERFINPDRASVLDIDSDVQSNRREQCITALENHYGNERVHKVATFKTEKSRSAILSAGRGLGIDIDTTRYIASLCKAPRGIPYTLTQMYEGDKEEGLPPNKEFVKQVSKHKGLWEVASKIEGLVTGLGAHAGGVIITEEPLVEVCGIMQTSQGHIVAAYDLHELEDLSLIKIDLLATEGLSKIRATLDLLIEYGYIEPEPTLKETYEKIIGVYNLDRETPEMWDMVHNNEIISLFQMEQQSGIQGIALVKPNTVEDLATLNSVIRLQPPDRQSERPLERFARYKQDDQAWDFDMEEYGLDTEEKELLHSMFDYSSGVAAQQEDLYQLMLSPKIVGYGFGQADVLRKAVAKKNPKDFKEFEDQFWEDIEKRKSSRPLARYIWNEMVVPQSGYSFNLAHCLSYSFVALQEMNLAYHYPIIFWNTANLIVDSGAEFVLEDVEEDELEEEIIEDDTPIANKTSDYGKIASAIGRMQQRGITILPPDINKSKWTFTPDPENNTIRYGLKGITRVGDSVIEDILLERPFDSVEDCISRVKMNKPQVVNLIKSGAFDEFGERRKIMNNYIDEISGAKKQLNLRNAQMLIREGFIPNELLFETKVFNFNKYIRKGYDKKGFLKIDENAQPFYAENFNMDNVKVENGIWLISEPQWKKIYNDYMNKIRQYIKDNHDELLTKVNQNLSKEAFDKYAKGSLAKWSMDAVNFYQGEHELDNVDLSEWNVVDFWELPVEPEVKSSFFTKQGYLVNLYHLYRIAGTVIDKDPLKSQITLLTTKGVVTVQAYGVMSAYDKQISEVQEDGKKKVMEKSWFSRGTKIIVNGMRRGDHTFIAKKYRSDKMGHHFYKIDRITEDGTALVQEERYEVQE